MNKLVVPLLSLVIWSAQAGAADEQKIAPNAPKDKPAPASSTAQLERMHQAMEPYVRQAKETYPDAKARYLKGLPRGQTFFVTTRLHDRDGREEQVFIAVNSIEGEVVRGVIYSQIQVVSGYTYRQPYTFPESDLIDWLIAKSDGSEEGNYVGKFMDTYKDR